MMKRHVLIGLFLSIVFSYHAQTLTDIALIQNVNAITSTSNHWGTGMVFYDFDDDGWDDLTFTLSNDSVAFFRNNNGVFERVGSYIYSIGEMRQLLWVDYNNDGALDICATYMDKGVRLYQNDGAFNFTDVTASSGISTDPIYSYGISFVDYDNDGDLDLYVANYESLILSANASSNFFYENQGDGTFVEVSSEVGINDGVRLSFMGVWFDYDNDDLIDLHVINDRQVYSDALYRNSGDGTFSNVAASAGVLNSGHNPMSSSISDYNNDGYQDIFVSDIANGTVTQGHPIDYKLYTNQPNGTFINRATVAGIDTTIFAWGGLWVDYNNDSFEDLYIATSELNDILPEKSSLFYKNNGGIDFTLINDSIDGDLVSSSYCPVKGDINNDGFYDIVVNNENNFPHVFLNSGNNGNNYIKLTPVGIVSNKRAIGAKIKVYANGQTQFQTVFCGYGFCSQNSQHMIFGVGNSTTVDSVHVIFPSGITNKMYNLNVNQHYTVYEMTHIYVDLTPMSADTIVICHGDSVVLGTGGYDNYLWSNGLTDSVITVHTGGNYSFTAQSTPNTMIISNEIHIVVESAPIYQELITQPLCGTDNLGVVELNQVNQSDTLNLVNWSHGEQGLLADSLLPGVYSYTVMTSNNCLYTSGTISIVASSPFIVQFITSPATDSGGGTIQLFVFGGTGPFLYMLDTTFVDAYVQDMVPGTYLIQVTDANGCVVDVSFTISDKTTATLEKNNSTRFNINYSNGSILISGDHLSEINTVEVISVTGTNIKLGDIEHADKCLKSMVSLTEGIYQVRIGTKGGNQVTPIFVH